MNILKYLSIAIIFCLNSVQAGRDPQWLYNQIDPGNRRAVPGPSQIIDCSSGDPFYKLGCPQGEYPKDHCHDCFAVTDSTGTKWGAYCAGCGNNDTPNIINNVDQCVADMNNYQWNKDYQYYGGGDQGGVLICAPNHSVTDSVATQGECDHKGIYQCLYPTLTTTGNLIPPDQLANIDQSNITYKTQSLNTCNYSMLRGYGESGGSADDFCKNFLNGENAP